MAQGEPRDRGGSQEESVLLAPQIALFAICKLYNRTLLRNVITEINALHLNSYCPDASAMCN